MFMSFMRRHYDSYAVMDGDGNCYEASRAECFAPTYDKRQRWYWDDDERTIAIRLPLTELGMKIGNAHLASLKKDERYHISRLQCVGFKTSGCRVTCSDCAYALGCESKQRDNNGFKCRRKCVDCPYYLSQTVGADNPACTLEIPLHSYSGHNPSDELERRLEIETLMHALETITDTQRELVRDIYWRKLTERQIAGRLKLKSSKTVNFRKKKVLDALRENELLRNIFENV
jgi:hypothetical protein